jgi:hypothetical protein
MHPAHAGVLAYREDRWQILRQRSILLLVCHLIREEIMRGRLRSFRSYALGTLVTLALPMAAYGQLTDPIPAKIPHGPFQIELAPMPGTYVSPDLLVSPQDGTNRQFILDQTGPVKVIENGVVLPTPFLDVSPRIATIVNPGQPNGLRAGFDERGMLGLAFDPGFTNSQSPGFRRVFAFYSEGLNATPDFPMPTGATPGSPTSQSVLASFLVDPANPNVVLPNSKQELLRIDKPQFNHNGGQLAFGPDGYLYLGLGDGGGANDGGTTNTANQIGHIPVTGNGQDSNVILGKVVRIDVNGTNSANGHYGIPPTNPFAAGGGVKEIFAQGFRNAYRFSFDRQTGRLIIPDVGQNNIEEINDNVQAGSNLGWRLKEGTFKFNVPDGSVSADTTGLPPGLTDPVAEYDHDEGISIIGGFVYRGSAIPDLVGKYVFGDFSTSFGVANGRLFYADPTDWAIHEFVLGLDDHKLNRFIKGFGEDQNGELYVMTTTVLGPTGSSGLVLRIVPVPEPACTATAILAAGCLLTRRKRR